MSRRRLDLGADLAGRAERIAAGHALADAAIAANSVDALRGELATAQSHLTHALDDATAQRARAEAAEAECARMRLSRGTVDRILVAWESIARAYRVDPSPANAERIATLATCATDVRDEATATRDAAVADAAGLRAVAKAADELVCCDGHAEVESYCETTPGSHAAAQVAAQHAYDDLVRAVDAMREAAKATAPDAAPHPPADATGAAGG